MTRTPAGLETGTAVVTERVPAPAVGRSGLVVLGGGALAYAVLIVAAFLGRGTPFMIGVLGVVVFELALPRWASFPAWMATRVEAGAGWRAMVRAVAALVLLVRADTSAEVLVVAGAGVLALALARAIATTLAEASRRQRKMPVVSRGLDLAELQIPSAPPAWAVRRDGAPVALTDTVLLVTIAAVPLLGADSAGKLVVPGVLASLCCALIPVAVLGQRVIAMRRVSRVRFDAAVRSALEEHAPQVVLYFGGTPDALYQVEMWVGTLERLAVPAVIILRDRESLRQLGPTRLPVLCVEHGGSLMELPMPALRLALYVSHAANNLHLLRRRGVRHVFIGHGDSDKAVSTNPYAKVYDENWVAGPAARDRFQEAGIGISDERIVEIGRPQLDALADTPPAIAGEDDDTVTVLYTPTWEGFADEPHQSSLASFGVDLVRWLLSDTDVRVLYRPHPLVGTRDRAVRRAHQEIVGLLGPDAAELPRPTDVADAAATAPDDLAVAAAPATISRTERMAALEVWSRKQLAADGRRTPHLVVPSHTFSLFTCFEVADALVSDVSSVISDFVRTERPYGVTNPTGLSAEEFTVRYPSSHGGYVIESDGAGLAELLAAARGEDDPRAGARAAVREHLLGPATPPSLQRMRAQVDRVLYL